VPSATPRRRALPTCNAAVKGLAGLATGRCARRLARKWLFTTFGAKPRVPVRVPGARNDRGKARMQPSALEIGHRLVSEWREQFEGSLTGLEKSQHSSADRFVSESACFCQWFETQLQEQQLQSFDRAIVNALCNVAFTLSSTHYNSGNPTWRLGWSVCHAPHRAQKPRPSRSNVLKIVASCPVSPNPFPQTVLAASS